MNALYVIACGFIALMLTCLGWFVWLLWRERDVLRRKDWDR
jgi:hypothetical protein